MKIKIISDGTAKNTTVIDQKTGERLEGVININWNIQVGGLSKCTIKLHNIPLEVYAGKIKNYELSNEK